MSEPAPDPAEARLGELLQSLREEEPESSHSLALTVVRRARWQARLRGALRTFGQFASAAGDVARMLFGREKERRA
jgi:hypothetical protein